MYDVFYEIILDKKVEYVIKNNTKFYVVDNFYKTLLNIDMPGYILGSKGYNSTVLKLSIRYFDDKIITKYCVSQTRIKRILRNMNTFNLNEEQCKSLLEVCKFFNINRDKDVMSGETIINIDNSIKIKNNKAKEAYDSFLEFFPPPTVWKKCPICEETLPYNKFFFSKMPNTSKIKYSNNCRKCLGKEYLIIWGGNCTQIGRGKVREIIKKSFPIYLNASTLLKSGIKALCGFVYDKIPYIVTTEPQNSGFKEIIFNGNRDSMMYYLKKIKEDLWEDEKK